MYLRAVNSCRCQMTLLRQMSTEAASVKVERKRATALRTPNDPLSHGPAQLGHFYNIPVDVIENVFGVELGIPRNYTKNIPTFGEASIMVRQPALDLISYLKQADYTHPAFKFVLYGKPGCGKTLTLVHTMHYAYLSKFVIVHVPWVWNWYKSSVAEVVTSESREGLYNVPVIAANWLRYFQQQNSTIMKALDLRLSKDYVWNIRETSAVNSPLLDVIQFGIGRMKYSCDVVDAIITELKKLSTEGRCKTLIAVDGFNQFLLPFSNLKKEDKTKVIPETMSLADTFLRAVKSDWTHGAIIIIADEMNTRDKNASATPLYLLGKRGFELLDPFIPIEVPKFTEFEFHSMLDYYEDRRWLQKPGDRDELEFVSARNPFYLSNLCTSL